MDKSEFREGSQVRFGPLRMYSSPSLQVELTEKVLFNVRSPNGGKQLSVPLHCALQPVELIATSRVTTASIR